MIFKNIFFLFVRQLKSITRLDIWHCDHIIDNVSIPDQTTGGWPIEIAGTSICIIFINLHKHIHSLYQRVIGFSQHMS